MPMSRAPRRCRAAAPAGTSPSGRRRPGCAPPPPRRRRPRRATARPSTTTTPSPSAPISRRGLVEVVVGECRPSGCGGGGQPAASPPSARRWPGRRPAGAGAARRPGRERARPGPRSMTSSSWPTAPRAQPQEEDGELLARGRRRAGRRCRPSASSIVARGRPSDVARRRGRRRAARRRESVPTTPLSSVAQAYAASLVERGAADGAEPVGTDRWRARMLGGRRQGLAPADRASSPSLRTSGSVSRRLGAQREVLAALRTVDRLEGEAALVAEPGVVDGVESTPSRRVIRSAEDWTATRHPTEQPCRSTRPARGPRGGRVKR